MLKNIIEYQLEETKLIKLENELTESASRKKASEIQQVLKSQQSELITLENLAKKTNNNFSTAVKKYEEYMKKLDALEKEIESASPEKSELYEKMYKDFISIGATLEKEIIKIRNEVKKISENYEDIIKKSKTLRTEFDKHFSVYKKLKDKNEPAIAELKTKLEKLEKNIDSKIMTIYKQKRDGHKFPVFSPLMEKKFGGCRMDISASKLEQMKTSELGIIECENCGRYIYQN